MVEFGKRQRRKKDYAFGLLDLKLVKYLTADEHRPKQPASLPSQPPIRGRLSPSRRAGDAPTVSASTS